MPTPEDLPDDITALKRMIGEMAREAATARAEIAQLKFQLARYRRAEFGRSSEKLARSRFRSATSVTENARNAGPLITNQVGTNC